MKAIRVYHADINGDFRKALREVVEHCDDMVWAGESSNGLEAAEQIRRMQLDVVVLCITLQEIDGFELLKKIKGIKPPPKVIVISRMAREYCVDKAMRLGADYYMLMPCPISVLCERIREIASFNGAAAAASDIHYNGPDKVLSELSFPPGLSGYRYIHDAISLLNKKHDISVTKELYPAIAQIRGTTPHSVERAIRHAIESAWARAETPERAKWFPGGVRPSNRVFFQRIVRVISSEERAHSLDTTDLLP